MQRPFSSHFGKINGSALPLSGREELFLRPFSGHHSQSGAALVALVLRRGFQLQVCLVWLSRWSHSCAGAALNAARHDRPGYGR
jgi:hypothetical protein